MKTLVALLSVQAALVTGTAYQNDIHLFGVKEALDIFKITCFSCLKPYDESADFYINDVQVDTVRYNDDKCYHKRKVCNPIECTCSKEGNNFTLSIQSDLSYMEFSCEMRSKDEATSKLSVQTAYLIFNETEFIPEMQRYRNIGFNEDTYTKIGTTDVNLIISGKIFNWLSRCISKRRNHDGKLFRSFLRRRKSQDDLLPLEDNNDCSTCDVTCALCEGISTCALCVNCRNHYCNACCEHHQEMNSDHIVFQTLQIAVNQRIVNCKSPICTKTAERICTNCWKPSCIACLKHNDCCKKKKIITIFQAHAERKRQKSVDVQEKLSLLYNAPFQDDKNPVRVCGIAYVADETVVVIDGNNWKLIAFKSPGGKSFMNKKLTNEPNAITTMTGNEFAITYPYKKYIQTYNLTLNTTQNTYQVLEVERICTNSKPFNIAYNQGKFAVEFGEREDGRICIFDITKKIIIETIKCNFAFFTGHTIRLALNQNRVFVSAMGKKMVFCMDFKGTKLWYKSVPSPRAIIVADDYSSSGKIILASKRCNAIYELKKEENHHEICKAKDKISSPRYMAYHSITKTLCVLVENDISHEDELAFLKFKDAESKESSRPAIEME